MELRCRGEAGWWVCLLPLIAGIALGSRIFRRIDQALFRRNVIYLLMVLASAGPLRSLF